MKDTILYIDNTSLDPCFSFALEYYLEEPLGALAFKTVMADNFLERNGRNFEMSREDIERCSQLTSQLFRSWKHTYGSEPRFNLINKSV